METSPTQHKTGHTPVPALAVAPSTLFLAAVVIGATSPTPVGLLAAALVAAVGIACAIVILTPPRLRARSKRAPRSLNRRSSLKSGDYVAFEGNLYRVEHVLGDRVLIEDCRNGELFDAAARDVEKARKVKRSARQVSASSGD